MAGRPKGTFKYKTFRKGTLIMCHDLDRRYCEDRDLIKVLWCTPDNIAGRDCGGEYRRFKQRRWEFRPAPWAKEMFNG